MKYLHDEAINEIWNLLKQVKEVRDMVRDWGIYYHSDCWTATYTTIKPFYADHEYWKENILEWNKEDFETIDISKFHSFNIGGSMSLCEHGIEEEPEQLVQAKADTIEHCLNKIAKEYKGKYFDISVYADKPYRDCGWECPIGIIATPSCESCREPSIMQEIIDILDSGLADVYFEKDDINNEKIYPTKPNGKFWAMIEYFSGGVAPDDDPAYEGSFSKHDLSGDYIRDAMNDINKTQNLAKKIQEEFKDKVSVVFLDFNKGCQYGCAINVWIKK